MRLCIRFLLLFFLFSCTDDKIKTYIGAKESREIVAIKLDTKSKDVKFSELFDSLFYVPIIEKSHLPSIAEVYKIKVIDEMICLFDDLNHALHIVNKSGQLVNAFYFDGTEGDGKFMDIEDFEVENDTLYLYERSRQRINIFNVNTGEYLGFAPFLTYFIEFKFFEDNVFVYADDNNYEMSNPLRDKFQIYDKDFKELLYSALPYQVGRDDFDTPQRFFSYSSKLYYTDLYNDTIFSFKGNEINSEFVVSFGSQKIPEKLLQTDDQDLISREFFDKKYFGFKHYLMVGNEMLAFWYREGLEQRYFQYDRSANTEFYNVSKIIDDVDQGSLPFPLTYDEDGEIFVSIVPKEQIDKEGKLQLSNSNLTLVYNEDILNYVVFYVRK